MASEWRPSADWEGFQGIIHGGVVTTVLDEAMSKAVASTGMPGLTCHLEVRLRQSVTPGDHLTVRAWVVEKRKRRVRVEAEIRDGRDTEKAHGWATFLTPGVDRNGLEAIPLNTSGVDAAEADTVAR
ncbi:MAG: PaaI family thioesterase [Bryobacterales bacterium]|nr:PaaI family thioesterase [Bryobacterales bacterium]